jgi:phosphonate transport system substrate-binding protein
LFHLALLLLGLVSTAWGMPGRANKIPEPVRIGLTPLAIDDQAAFLKRLGDYLEKRLHRPVVFVQAANPRRAVELLHQHPVDFAWIPGYYYVRFQRWTKLVAVPVSEHKPGCRSYLIVPAADAQSHSLWDLRNKVFAYPDPSAYLNVQFELALWNEKSGAFFRKDFSTGSQRNVIEAVGVGLAQGGVVDSCAWDVLSKTHPELTSRTAILHRSTQLVPPPFVAKANIGRKDFDAMRKALLEMADDPEGASLLKTLDLDGFAPADARMFDGVARMARFVNGF